MIHTTIFSKGEKEYVLAVDDQIPFEVVIKVMDFISSNSPTKAGDAILLAQADKSQTSPEIFSQPFLRAQAALYCLKFFESFEIEEKKS